MWWGSGWRRRRKRFFSGYTGERGEEEEEENGFGSRGERDGAFDCFKLHTKHNNMFSVYSFLCHTKHIFWIPITFSIPILITFPLKSLMYTKRVLSNDEIFYYIYIIISLGMLFCLFIYFLFFTNGLCELPSTRKH